jgi:hypothetical protein
MRKCVKINKQGYQTILRNTQFLAQKCQILLSEQNSKFCFEMTDQAMPGHEDTLSIELKTY